jgi:hypothetical protein
MHFKRFLAIVVCFWLFSFPPNAPAQVKCVNAEGEAAVIKGDVPSAKIEAAARAKWAAIEKVVGVEVKAQSFVQNMTLFDDAVKSEAKGIIKNYQVIDQQNKDDVLTLKIKACVEPVVAREAVSSLALNNSIAVYIPARKPRGNDYDESNILSEMLIAKLKGQDYTVVDIAPTHAADAVEIENAAKSGNIVRLRGLFNKFLSNLLVIGKIDWNISTRKGEDIGYGLSMPFNNATVRMNYRIVARNSKTGNTEILWSDTAQGKGLANRVEDAAAAGLKDLAEKITPSILEKVADYIQENVKKITVNVKGSDFDSVTEIKGIFQKIAWVTDVQERSASEFIVSYSENSIYLANSIKQKGDFNILNFSSYRIDLEYIK